MSFQVWEVVRQHGVTQHGWGVLGQLRGEDIAGLSSTGSVQAGLHALGSLVLDSLLSGPPGLVQGGGGTGAWEGSSHLSS